MKKLIIKGKGLFNKLIAFVSKIYKKFTDMLLKHPDKVLHFAAGMAIFCIFSLFIPIGLAIFLTAVIAMVKEVIDHNVSNNFSFVDLIITILGLALASAAVLHYVYKQ